MERVEIITSEVLGGDEDGGAVTFVRGDERVETRWDKVFAVEELYEALKKLIGCVAAVRNMSAEYGGVILQSKEEIEAIELLKQLSKARGET